MHISPLKCIQTQLYIFYILWFFYKPSITMNPKSYVPVYMHESILTTPYIVVIVL